MQDVMAVVGSADPAETQQGGHQNGCGPPTRNRSMARTEAAVSTISSVASAMAVLKLTTPGWPRRRKWPRWWPLFAGEGRSRVAPELWP